jgi:hypothetical protein
MKQVFLTEHLLFYFFVLKPIYVLNPVDWSGRHEDSSENANAFPSCVGKFKDAQSMSCGISGKSRQLGFFKILPREKRSAWNENQQPSLTQHLF